MKKLKVDIFQKGRFVGTLSLDDRWQGLFVIDEKELTSEIERRLPTLRKGNYQIAF